MFGKGKKHSSKDPWGKVTSFVQLQDRMISFLLGHLDSTIWGAIGIEHVTDKIRLDLIMLQAAGFVSVEGQPGGKFCDGKTCEIQRAYITGIVLKSQAHAFERNMRKSGKIVFVREEHKKPIYFSDSSSRSRLFKVKNGRLPLSYIVEKNTGKPKAPHTNLFVDGESNMWPIELMNNVKCSKYGIGQFSKWLLNHAYVYTVAMKRWQKGGLERIVLKALVEKS